MIELINGDCLDYMRGCADKEFELAIVDPPYGIKADKDAVRRKKREQKLGGYPNDYTEKNWDAEPPPQEYFDELFRISKNQIIWGANHFIDRINKPSSCWVVWDKLNGEFSYADCELAWTSFKTAVRKFEWRWAGYIQQSTRYKEIRIHPTQKPVALYKWLLQNYNKDKGRVLDTHLGSGSIAIACHDMQIPLVGIEIDEEYYVKAKERLEREQSQLSLLPLLA